jgi:2-iminoacetate synthase ThiH
VGGLRAGPTGAEVQAVHAVSRIFLHGHIDNIQAGAVAAADAVRPFAVSSSPYVSHSRLHWSLGQVP